MAENLTTSDFKTRVLAADRPVLVDFWAGWCGPCHTQLPIIDEVAADLGDAAHVAKVDVDAEPALAQLFDIRSIPTLLLFKSGKIVRRFQGVTSRQALVAAVRSA